MADRLSAVSGVLLVGASACLGWGMVGTAPQPREAGLLIDRLGAHRGDEGWELQLVETCLALRPWHAGYGRCRGALRDVGADRLTRAGWGTEAAARPPR